MWSDLFALAGLLLTLIGAVLTARSVILSEDQALHIGVARYVSGKRDQDLQLPAVQNLLGASRGAQRGLCLIAVGTLLQACPVAFAAWKSFV
jgi:hypothetical protein